METNIEIGNQHYLVQEEGQLHGLIQGVNYIMSYYKDVCGIILEEKDVLAGILAVVQIQKIKNRPEDFLSIDSFIREKVYEFIQDL